MANMLRRTKKGNAFGCCSACDRGRKCRKAAARERHAARAVERQQTRKEIEQQRAA